MLSAQYALFAGWSALAELRETDPEAACIGEVVQGWYDSGDKVIWQA